MSQSFSARAVSGLFARLAVGAAVVSGSASAALSDAESLASERREMAQETQFLPAVTLPGIKGASVPDKTKIELPRDAGNIYIITANRAGQKLEAPMIFPEKDGRFLVPEGARLVLPNGTRKIVPAGLEFNVPEALSADCLHVVPALDRFIFIEAEKSLGTYKERQADGTILDKTLSIQTAAFAAQYHDMGKVDNVAKIVLETIMASYNDRRAPLLPPDQMGKPAPTLSQSQQFSVLYNGTPYDAFADYHFMIYHNGSVHHVEDWMYAFGFSASQTILHAKQTVSGPVTAEEFTAARADYLEKMRKLREAAQTSQPSSPSP